MLTDNFIKNAQKITFFLLILFSDDECKFTADCKKLDKCIYVAVKHTKRGNNGVSIVSKVVELRFLI